ncbi:hypothetical protein GMORB2_0909 [Geosmithia morbida]|uniref:Uncharacterized protein n=1 Tax=Geosmithia morbida TaxID=1094350 RepID=A0A9P4Z0X4_9HYPO|nr:uncharacterized protein GMORB2_0909 [Geosmithia morbida]KAF4125665.1 hypothetical protein GMORB2_0909 [Geosmithia morbida]
MSSLPSQHPTLSLHLTDSALTPLITSSSSPTHLDSLTSLASTALTSHTAASRVNLGCPQRIMVEYPDHGAVVLQSYIDPHQHHAHDHHNQPSSSSSSRSASSIVGAARPSSAFAAATTATPALRSYTTPDPDDAPPRLVSVVVAGSADQAREARRAAARLERLGRDFQREWATESLTETTTQPW